MMKTLTASLSLLPLAAFATGYSGLHNDLLLVYGFFIGLVLVFVSANWFIRKLKNKRNQVHVSETE